MPIRQHLLSSLVRASWCALGLALVPHAAFAQAPAQTPPPTNAQTAAQTPLPAVAPPPAAVPVSPITVKWNNGLSLESADGDNKLQLGTLLQVDGRFAANNPAPIVDTVLIRRGRFLFQGRLSKYFEFNFVPDFAGNTLTLFDAYIDTKFSTGFGLRAGKTKAPIGLEQLYSDATLPFAERSVGTNLTPNRDVGITALGDLWHGHVSYVGGVENGSIDAASSDVDVNAGKDLVGRLTVTDGPIGVAVGASHGQQTGALPSFKSTAQQTFFSYGTGVTALGARDRVSPSFFAYYRQFGGFVEYFRSAQVIAKSTATTAIANTGWNATGIIVVTGEPASERGVTPKSPFDPAKHHWGSLQIAVRVSGLTVDPAVFANSLAAAGASRTARAIGVSAVWNTTANVKHVLTYERTTFDSNASGARKPENAIIFRIQLNLAPRL